MTTPALLLAAGASSRMGTPKALLDIDGRPAVEHIVDVLRRGGAHPVVVVLGADAARIRAEADLTPATVVPHPGWAAGRTSSIQGGMDALPAGADGFLLALVDMPLVRPATVAELLGLWAANCGRWDAAVPAYAGRRGHPIVLGAALWEAIRALGPDQPLRDVVRAADAMVVDVPDRGVLVDLDTPEDLGALGHPE